MAEIDRLLGFRGAGERGSTRAVRASLLGVMIFILVSAACASFASAFDRAYTYRRLHSFCSRAGCADGEEPDSVLLADAAGNLYGTTWLGGGVYELVLEGQKWKFQIIHRFPGIAVGNLIMDMNGNLYGTTLYGIEAKRGTVFEMSPRQAAGAGS